MSRTSDIPIEIQDLIIRGICNADCWGGGRITYARECVEAAGYKWLDEYEDYVFEFGREWEEEQREKEEQK